MSYQYYIKLFGNLVRFLKSKPLYVLVIKLIAWYTGLDRFAPTFNNWFPWVFASMYLEDDYYVCE